MFVRHCSVLNDGAPCQDNGSTNEVLRPAEGGKESRAGKFSLGAIHSKMLNATMTAYLITFSTVLFTIQRTIHSTPSLSLSLSYSHSLSVPLLRVGRSMSRLDMWRMKGAEQPTCTRETIFFSFLSFPPSLFLFSLFFFCFFSLSFSSLLPLPLFKAAPLCFRARATFQYRIVVLKKSEWMRWRDKKKKKKKKGGGTIVALLSTTTNFMLLARYWPIPSILPLIYIYREAFRGWGGGGRNVSEMRFDSRSKGLTKRG